MRARTHLIYLVLFLDINACYLDLLAEYLLIINDFIHCLDILASCEFNYEPESMFMNSYRAEIDGIRALAVIPVILFHAEFPFFDGGFVGVDIFFS